MPPITIGEWREFQDKYNSYWLGMPSYFAEMVHAAQAESLWCWAAGIATVLRALGIDEDQRPIVDRLTRPQRGLLDRFLTDIGLVPLPNVTATIGEIDRILNASSVPDRSRQNYAVLARGGFGPPSANMVASELRDRRPMLLALKGPPGQPGHIVVLTAARIRLEGGIHRLVEVVIRDPAPQGPNSGRRVETWPGLRSQIMAAWVVRAAYVPDGRRRGKP